MVRSAMTTEEKEENLAALPGRGVAALQSIGHWVEAARRCGTSWRRRVGSRPWSGRALRCGCRWWSAKKSHADSSPTSACRAIARRLGRAPSTVSREVAGHGGRVRYRAAEADRAAWRWARRPKPAKLVVHRELAVLVADKLRAPLVSPSRSRLGFAVSIPRTRSCRCHTKRSTRRCSCSRGAR